MTSSGEDSIASSRLLVSVSIGIMVTSTGLLCELRLVFHDFTQGEMI